MFMIDPAALAIVVAKPAATPVDATPMLDRGVNRSPRRPLARCSPNITSVRTPIILPRISLLPSILPVPYSVAAPIAIPATTQGNSLTSLSH